MCARCPFLARCQSVSVACLMWFKRDSNVFTTFFRQVTDALKKHVLPFEHWIGLLKTNGAINAIAKGELDKMTAALKKHDLPFEHWIALLSTGGAINAIANGALDKETAALK